MKHFLPVLLSVFLLSSCAAQSGGAVKIPSGSSKGAAEGEAVATFAEGCFWHSEIVFQSLKGVRDAVSGYAGGKVANPDYELVGTGNTGHAESVRIL